jgi:hypothetical protein
MWQRETAGLHLGKLLKVCLLFGRGLSSAECFGKYSAECWAMVRVRVICTVVLVW